MVPANGEDFCQQSEAADRRPFCGKAKGISGEPEMTMAPAAVVHQADPQEPQDHHCPGGGLGNGRGNSFRNPVFIKVPYVSVQALVACSRRLPPCRPRMRSIISSSTIRTTAKWRLGCSSRDAAGRCSRGGDEQFLRQGRLAGQMKPRRLLVP